MSNTAKDMSVSTIKGSLLNKVLADLRLETQIVFPDASLAPAAGLTTVEVPIEVHDANGRIVNVSSEDVQAKEGVAAKEGVTEVTVDIDSGTATGKQLTGVGGTQQDVDASAIVRLLNGRGTVTVNVASTGTVVLGLTDSQGSGLTVSDTITITFS